MLHWDPHTRMGPPPPQARSPPTLGPLHQVGTPLPGWDSPIPRWDPHIALGPHFVMKPLLQRDGTAKDRADPGIWGHGDEIQGLLDEGSMDMTPRLEGAEPRTRGSSNWEHPMPRTCHPISERDQSAGDDPEPGNTQQDTA